MSYGASIEELIEQTVKESVEQTVKESVGAILPQLVNPKDAEVVKLRAHVRDLQDRNARLLKENHRVRESRRKMMEDLMNDPRFGAGR